MPQAARERLEELLEHSATAALAHEHLARYHQDHNRWDEAAAEWRALIAVDSTRIVGRMGLGKQHLALGEWAEAIHQFESVRTEDPTRADALYGLGKAHLLEDLNPTKAAGYFRSYLEAERKLDWPSPARAYYYLAMSLTKQGDYGEARAELERAEAEVRHDHQIRENIKELERKIEDLSRHGR
jgi:tetratricopeptide (TPR) repeat protein